MQLTLIKNTDASGVESLSYRVARVVYAQTGGISLPLIEAFTSMIKNIAMASSQNVSDIISDSNIFPVLDEADINHSRMYVSSNDKRFQMCQRTAHRMLSGGMPDCCYGATKYHFANVIPDWATSRGYIADIDGVLFYQ